MNDPSQHPSDSRVWWSINVTGYGRFAYYGTLVEADQMKRDKAEWEGGRGTMRRATDSEVAEEVKHLRWKNENEYPLDERELEAIR